MALSLADKDGEIMVSIKLGGVLLAADIGLLSLVVERTMNKIATAQLVLQDDDSSGEAYPVSNKDFTKPGTTVEVMAGYDVATELLFKGIVVSQRLKINNTRSVIVLECRDSSISLTRIKRSAYYYDQKDSDIAAQLINESGLVADVEATTVTHAEMVQYQTTNWDFVLTRAQANGQLVATLDGTIKIMVPPASGTSKLTVSFGENVIDFDAVLDARQQYSSMEFTAWDAASQELLVSASATPGMLSHGDMAPSDLSAAIPGETFTSSHSGNVAPEEGKAMADAGLLHSRLAALRGRVSTVGVGGVTLGDIISLAGFGNRFNGDVMVSGIRHDLSMGNWKTDIQFGLLGKWHFTAPDVAAPPAGGMLPPIQGLQAGVVTALEADPDGEFRIKVKVPVINANEEGTWARQATADAGNGRGWVIRPEIGDEVIVGFINNDPRDAIVLGALHSSRYAAPLAAADDNHEKGWTTRSGIKILVNDEKKSIEISTPAGNQLLLDEDAKNIHLKDQHGNELTMSSSDISISSIKDITLKASGDIQLEGTNVNVKASAAITCEGSASATVKSSGTTTIKGSMVMIN